MGLCYSAASATGPSGGIFTSLAGVQAALLRRERALSRFDELLLFVAERQALGSRASAYRMGI